MRHPSTPRLPEFRSTTLPRPLGESPGMKRSCDCGAGLVGPESPVGVITVIPRTRFTFHGSTLGVPPPPTVMPLRTRIETSQWTSGVLLVRVHAKTFPSATSYAEVEVYNDGYTPEDPSQVFVESLLRGVATIPNGAMAGTLYAVDTSQPIASLMRVELRFHQGSTNSGVSSLTLSAVLVGRRSRSINDSPAPQRSLEPNTSPPPALGPLVGPIGRRILPEYRIDQQIRLALSQSA